MCVPLLPLAMAATALAGGVSAYSAIQQGKVAQKTANYNATMAERAAADAVRAGEDQAQQVNRQTAALKGAQRVGMASNGLDLTYGTASDLQEQTDFFGQSDANMARFNAGRQGWNLQAQAMQERYSGNMARRNANLQATGSLLASAGQVAGGWYAKGSPGFSGTQSAAPISNRSI